MWIRRVAAEHRRTSVVLAGVLLLAAAGQPVVALAQPAQSQPGDEELILTVRANGVERGDVALVRTADGDYWIEAGDLPRLKLTPVDAARRQRDGATWYSFRALGAERFDYDEPRLTLGVVFPAGNIAGTTIDLGSRSEPIPITDPGRSLILGYRISARQAGQGQPVRAAFEGDANLRVGPVLIRQEAAFDEASVGGGFRRGVTQLLWDVPRWGARVTAGDLVSSAGAFGSAITGAGLQVRRLYELTPEVVRQPTATLQASAALPADVELAVDGATVFRTRVGPGPITLSNLTLFGGSRNVRLTVTDASGRREVFEQPFLFTDTVLARGLHEFSYFAGRRSELDAGGQWRYREVAWQASHRWGLDDAITLAAGGEGNASFRNAGVGATVRSNRFGLFALDALVSDSAGARASGWSGRYTYVLPHASLLFGHRQFGEGFRTFTTSAQMPFLRSETRLGVSGQLGWANVSGDVTRTTDALATRLARTLRLSTRIARGATLSTEYQATHVNGRPEWSASVFLRVDLDRSAWVSSSARAAPSWRSLDVETGRPVGQGEGFGYRVGMSRTMNGGRSSLFGIASSVWNLQPATLEFFGSAQAQGGNSRYFEAAVTGAVVGVDGFWGLTRRVSDGFVLAKLGVAHPGVDVYLNNQRQGRTDGRGMLFIPQVGSFGRQDVSVDAGQVPMNYLLRTQRQTIAPAYRSGTVVHFGARPMRAATGMAWLVQGDRRLPIASRSWQVKGPDGGRTMETASSGDFYLEDATPGLYQGTLRVDGRNYQCRLSIPESAEAVLELTEGIVCE